MEVVTINVRRHRLWRTVDLHGAMFDVLMPRWSDQLGQAPYARAAQEARAHIAGVDPALDQRVASNVFASVHDQVTNLFRHCIAITTPTQSKSRRSEARSSRRRKA
ncbi:hypothetical protein [Paraburkholderia phenazinium]|uniref:hypothetical protein n=1 Tax=Paraburkholderia phenazinium TaxID=60549 RepID=UPI000940FC10|nr:hypothetical protein [Paraburkholderia phenazinium]